MNSLSLPAPRAIEDSTAPLRQFLTLSLGEELFALPIEHIREIIEFGGLTRIPMAPPFLRGVFNLRGAVVPVIDLALRFEREPTRICRRTCIVIVELSLAGSRQLLGVIVDAVNEVLAVEARQLERRPPLGARIRADFISGILRHQDAFIVALDIPQVLSLDEQAELLEVIAQGDSQVG